MRAADADIDARDIDLRVFYRYGGYGAEGVERLKQRLHRKGARAQRGFWRKWRSCARRMRRGSWRRCWRRGGGSRRRLRPGGGRNCGGDCAGDAIRRPAPAPVVRAAGECAHVALDLTGDGWTEHCLVRGYPDYVWMDCFVREGNGFKRIADSRRARPQRSGFPASA